MFASIVAYVALYCALVALFAPAPIVRAVQPITENVDVPDVNVHVDISTENVAGVAAPSAVPSPSCATPHMPETGAFCGLPWRPVIVVLATVCDTEMV